MGRGSGGNCSVLFLDMSVFMSFINYIYFIIIHHTLCFMHFSLLLSQLKVQNKQINLILYNYRSPSETVRFVVCILIQFNFCNKVSIENGSHLFLNWQILIS